MQTCSSSASDSQNAGVTDVCHHGQLLFVHLIIDITTGVRQNLSIALTSISLMVSILVTFLSLRQNIHNLRRQRLFWVILGRGFNLKLSQCHVRKSMRKSSWKEASGVIAARKHREKGNLGIDMPFKVIAPETHLFQPSLILFYHHIKLWNLCNSIAFQ